ncbi:MAG TPA: protein kinase, partial [Planctomycetia bacterium]|nr:protein kinase [Planctomycetia bacterium]
AQAPGDIPKAVKVGRLEDPNGDLVAREIAALKKMRGIRHPYVLSLERFEIVDDHLLVITELAEGTLLDRFRACGHAGTRGIPREELLGYMREAAEALDLLSQTHGLQHLDVKPGNIFLSGGHVKVADFDLVHPKNETLPATSLAFSPPFAPPELFEGRVEETADQYSLAVTYQEMLTGTRPYHGTDIRSIIGQHLSNKPDLSLLPAADRPIVARALDKDSFRRFATCGEFVEKLTKAASFGHATIQLSPNLGAAPTLDPDTTRKPAAVQFVVHGRNGATNGSPVTDKPGSRTTRKPQEINGAPDLAPETGRFIETFLAYAPLEIYALKLRGFIDDMKAEIVSCTDEKAVLLFTTRNWLGVKSKKGLFMQIDACCRTPHSGYRALEVIVWPAGEVIPEEELGRRARLLVRILRGYLIATAKSQPALAVAKLRQELLN